MASLDNLEGEAVETTVLILLVVLAVLIYYAWKGGQSLAGALSSAWGSVIDFLKSLFQSGNLGSSGGMPGSIATAYAGSDQTIADLVGDPSSFLSQQQGYLASGQISLSDYEKNIALIGG